MKIVYAGTPSFAIEPLNRILAAGYKVAGVIAQPDRPQGRKGILTPPPVKAFALEKGLPVFQPNKIKDFVEELKALGGDLFITCAYGQILTEGVLNAFPKGVWNIHAGLLPAYRGASPIQSAVLNGERETGVTVMKTELGLDTGDILLCKKTPIGERETFGELSERLSILGGECIVESLKLLESGEYTLVKQTEEGAAYTKKINKEQAKIDFSKSPEKIVDLVRGMNPEPAAYTLLGGVKINVFSAEPAEGKGAYGEILSDSPKIGLIVACNGGAVKLTEVQAAGGKRMTGEDFLNGRKAKRGQVFSC